MSDDLDEIARKAWQMAHVVYVTEASAGDHAGALFTAERNAIAIIRAALQRVSDRGLPKGKP